MDGSYRDHERLDGIDHSTRDTLERGYHLGGDIDRVDCLMRCRTVASFSYYSDHERIRCRHYSPSSKAEYAGVEITINVESKYIVDLGILHYAVFDHRFRSSSASMFLGGLEDELHRAVKLVPVSCEEFGRPE